MLERVLYCSLHRYDNAAFYPGSPDGNYDMVGSDKGAGYNINVAWNWVCIVVLQSNTVTIIPCIMSMTI